MMKRNLRIEDERGGRGGREEEADRALAYAKATASKGKAERKKG
jgi:hypothetical protein